MTENTHLNNNTRMVNSQVIEKVSDVNVDNHTQPSSIQQTDGPASGTKVGSPRINKEN